jgi:hypothetical protein
MQVVTAAQTGMACQRSSRIIYRRSLKLCLMIRERCRTYGKDELLRTV